MGGWGAALGGALTGVGQQAHEDNLLKLQQAAQQKEAMMGFYKSIMDNPALEHMAPEAAQAFLHISSTPIDQKWSKSADKFIKQYDPSMLNQQAVQRHASQHPGVQQGQQLQLPPGLTPASRPGVAGQQVGAADGAAHQTAMNSPGVGAVPGDAQPQQQQPQISQPPQQPNPQQMQGEATNMLAETTQTQQGALPSPGPVPQITPSPAQASASAGYTDPLGQAPAMPDSMVHPHWGRTPAERAEQTAYGTAMEQRAKLTGTLQETKALRRDAEQVKKDWMADPATQQALKNHDYMALSVSAPPGVTIPNIASMQIPRLIGANVSGAEAAPNTIDHNGNPVDPSKHYTVRSVMGQDVWVPTDIRQSSSWMVDPTNPAKEIQVHVDPYSGSVSLIAGTDGKPLTRIKPGMLESNSSNTTQRVVQVNGQDVLMPITSTSKKTKTLPGAGTSTPGTVSPPPTQAPRISSPSSATSSTSSNGLPKGSRVLGDTQGTFNLQQPTATTRTMAQSAPAVLQLANDLKKRVEQQKQMLGPAAGRWNEFYAGKVGAPNPEFSKIRTDATLLQTKLMKMHTGSNGAVAIMQHFKDILDTSKQSPENMIAALDTIMEYATGVAQEGDLKRNTTVSPPPSSGGGGGGVTELERGPDGKLRIKSN